MTIAQARAVVQCMDGWIRLVAEVGNDPPLARRRMNLMRGQIAEMVQRFAIEAEEAEYLAVAKENGMEVQA